MIEIRADRWKSITRACALTGCVALLAACGKEVGGPCEYNQLEGAFGRPVLGERFSVEFDSIVEGSCTLVIFRGARRVD